MLTCSNHSATKQSARRCGQLNPQKTRAQEAIKILNIVLFEILPFKAEPEKNERTTVDYNAKLTTFMATGSKPAAIEVHVHRREWNWKQTG